MEKVRIPTVCLQGIISSPPTCIFSILSGSFSLLENHELERRISVTPVVPPVFEMRLLETNLISKAFHAFVRRYDKYINWFEVTGIVFLIIATVTIVTNDLTGLYWLLFRVVPVP